MQPLTGQPIHLVLIMAAAEGLDDVAGGNERQDTEASDENDDDITSLIVLCTFLNTSTL